MKFILIFLFILSCQKTSLRITTVPDKALVSIFDSQTNTFQKLGQTPLTISEHSDLPYSAQESDVWGLSIEKKGHIIEHIFFDRSANENFSLNTRLKRFSDWTDTDSDQLSELANKVGKGIQKVNQFIKNSNYSDALTLIEKLIQQFPKSSIFYDIKGSLYLLQGRRGKAIASYKKSLKLNPDSIETQRTLERLGGRL